ncbi:hypothetical protein LTSESEN_2610, partial [Salmonella enterica subsp. enterica serovar Senftenberg str. A4-543]
MENAFSEKYKYAFRNLELKELRRFILKELIIGATPVFM